MPKCFYCGELYDTPRGLTLVMNDGVIKYLCSSKCRKNMLMKRRKVRWVSKSKTSKEEMSVKEDERIAREDARKDKDKLEAEKKESKNSKKQVIKN